MSNMAYCRFHNTLQALKDASDALDEIEGNLSELSKDEARAANNLILLCQKIGADFDDAKGATT